MGISHSLVKPFKRKELATLVESVLGRSREDANAGDASEQTSAVRPLKLLVADDSPVNQEVAAGLLNLMGHTVLLADDGQQAVDLFKRENLDLIFMDAEMPNLDGLAATRMIRGLEESSGTHIPIVGLSAHALVGFREECLAAGMDGYITKPIQPEELFRALALADVPQHVTDSVPC